MSKMIMFALSVVALISLGLSVEEISDSPSNVTSAYGILNASEDARSLSTFSTALLNAGMVEALENQGILIFDTSPYYIFAPNDAAFANYTGLGTLMANQTDLGRVLSYHVAWSRAPLDLNATKSLLTLEGENLTLAYNKGLTVNGARVLKSVVYDHGTIYLIDKVLVPKRTTGPAGMGLLDAINSLGDAKKFSSYLQSVGFVERLNGQEVMGIEALSEGPFIIFAPNDAAFSNLSASIASAIGGSNQANMRTFLSYHVVSNASEAKVAFNRTGANSTSMANFATLEGSSLVIDTSMGQVNGAKVLKAIRYGNGVVYEIDQVLIPIKLSLGSAIDGSTATGH